VSLTTWFGASVPATFFALRTIYLEHLEVGSGSSLIIALEYPSDFYLTMSAADELSDDDLQTVYCWVDSIQLSRPKRNISRDFADGGK
jgi:hypothetical protein